MNRNMQGERFSRTELISMAVAIGAIEPDEATHDTKTHVFERMTMKHRHAMFMRGEAILDTRPEPAKVRTPLKVDRELLSFFGVKV